MKSGLHAMLNQIRRLWADDGRSDKDFAEQERKLKVALEHLRDAASSLSRASEQLLSVIRDR